jgi:hypothetical protein
VDILRAIGIARQLGGAVRAAQLPDWAFDPEAFHVHFGVPHEHYAAIVSALSPEQAQMLDATLAVNPEAAVLWILHMEPLA